MSKPDSESSISCSVSLRSLSLHSGDHIVSPSNIPLSEWLKGYAKGFYSAGCEPPVLPDRSSPLSTTTEHESQGSPEQVYRKLGWLPPPFPPNETERLKALYRYGILSRDPDNPGGMDRNPTLNKIVRMAQKIFKVPAVVILVVDKDKLPVLASVGYRTQVYDRESSMCGHSILLDRPHVMLDVTKDFRFTTLHPYTAAATPMRFYAGTQLRDKDGFALGTLCLIDDKPHESFPEEQKELLVDFGKLAVREIEKLMTESHLARVSQLSSAVDLLNREISALGDLASETNLKQVYSLASDRIAKTLDLKGGCSIIDVSAFTKFKATQSTSVDSDSYHYRLLDEEEPATTLPVISESLHPSLSNTPFSTSAFSLPTPISAPNAAVLDSRQLGAFLDLHPAGKIFTADEIPTFIGYSLPTNVQTAFLLPVLNMDKSALALICAWTCDETQEILDVEYQFIRAVEGVLMSSSILRTIQGADHAKFAFISSMSHELRTPLHGILASTELLSETSLGNEQLAYLDTIKLSGANLLDIVNHVLDYTKASSSVLGREKKFVSGKLIPINLSSFVEETVNSVCVSHRFSEARKLNASNAIGSLYNPQKLPDLGQLGGTQVEVLLDFEKGLEKLFVRVDNTGLRRIMYNLLTNSLKYTQKGFVRVFVQSSTPGPGLYPFTISVADTGIGMNPSFVKDHLFAPFSQESSSHPGAGLGLSITKSIVESMGGRIDVQSVEHQGTTFKVVIPLEVVQNPTSVSSSVFSTPLPDGVTAYLSGLSLQMQQLVIGYFKQWGIKISTSTTPDRNDIVVLDNSADPLALARYKSIFRTIHLLGRQPPCDPKSSIHYQVILNPCGPQKLYCVLQTLLSTKLPMPKTASPTIAEPIPCGPSLPVPSIPALKPTTPLPSYKSDFQSHVLIVEDNPINRGVLRAFLSKKKILFKEAHDGQEGVEMFESHPPGFFSFVAMDVHMPRLDGIDASARIRGIEKARLESDPTTVTRPVMIYALTGSSSTESQRRSWEVGINGFLVKPVRFDKLWPLVQDSMQAFES